MILTGFTRPTDPIDAEKLSKDISTNLGKQAWVTVYPSTIEVSGAAITGADTSPIQSVLNSYAYVNPNAVQGLTGPRGLQGVQGPQGDIGPQGLPGNNAPSDHTLLSNIGTKTHAQIDTHINDVNNPHATTKAQVSLGNVDNTSDVNKPVSTAQATALGGKQPLSYATLANGATAMGLATTNTVKVTPTALATYTTTVPPAGTECRTIILTSGVSSFTITFGTGFKPTATLATGTTSARVFVLSWVSDGTSLYEASRTVAMVA